MFSLRYFMLGIDTFVIARIKQIYLLHLCNIWGNALIYLYKLFFVIGFKKKNYIHFVFINFHYLNLCHSMLLWWHFYFYFYFYNEDSNNKEPNLCIPGSTVPEFFQPPLPPAAPSLLECVCAFLSVAMPTVCIWRCGVCNSFPFSPRSTHTHSILCLRWLVTDASIVVSHIFGVRANISCWRVCCFFKPLVWFNSS